MHIAALNLFSLTRAQVTRNTLVRAIWHVKMKSSSSRGGDMEGFKAIYDTMTMQVSVCEDESIWGGGGHCTKGSTWCICCRRGA